MKDIRCTDCGAEFCQDDLPEDAHRCPTCGATGVPMFIADDTTIKINTHELRILTIWASNYAESIKDEHPGVARTLRSIIGRLSVQLPGSHLTMADEIQDIADTFGQKVEVRDAKGKRTVEPKKKN